MMRGSRLLLLFPLSIALAVLLLAPQTPISVGASSGSLPIIPRPAALGCLEPAAAAEPTATPDAQTQSRQVWQLAPKDEAPLEPLPPRTGLRPFPFAMEWLEGDQMPPGVTAASLASHFDWREQGKVSTVEDQGACGSCYSFASLGNLESKMLIDNAGTWNFSQNNVKECNWQEVNNWQPSPGINWGSCDGATAQTVVNWLTKKGTVLETCDPYVARDVECKNTCPYQKTLLEWRQFNGKVYPDPSVIKAALQTYGPLYTTIYAGHNDAWGNEFSNYNGSYVLYYTGTERTNHAVLLVGWDDSWQHRGGQGAWIVRNSWGTNWGDHGYFYIAYNSASIAFDTSAFSGYMDYDSAGGLMAYDEAGLSDAVGCGTTTAWALTKFVPTRNTRITRVEFWTFDVTTDVDLYIYDSFDGNRPSTLLWSRANLSYPQYGYYSVPVSPALNASSGNDLILVAKITNQTAKYPIPIDQAGPHESQRCFASCDGTDGNWLDLATVMQPAADSCMHLRYSDPAPVVTATSTRTPTKTPTFRPFTPSRWIRLPIILRKAYLSPVVPPTPNGQPTSTRTRTPVGPTPTRTATRPAQATPTATRPSGSGYIVDDSVPMQWVDAGAGTTIPGGDDWCRGSYPLGFTFNFYGMDYTRFWVNTNGMVLFTSGSSEPNGGDSWINTYIPNRASPNNMAALFWDDLKPISGAVMRYQTFGSAPNRYCVIEWNNVGRYDDFDHPMTFEAVFVEGSNDIVFQYLSVSANSQGSGTSATIGLENANGSAGVPYGYNQAVLRDGLAVLFRYGG